MYLAEGTCKGVANPNKAVGRRQDSRVLDSRGGIKSYLGETQKVEEISRRAYETYRHPAPSGSNIESVISYRWGIIVTLLRKI